MSSVVVYLGRDISPNTNPAAPRVYNRPARRSAPSHPMTSCRVRDAPNDLERRRREVAALEKPPQRVFSRRPTRTVVPATDAPRFDAFSTNGLTVPHTRKLKASKHKTNHDELLPGVLGSATTQISRAEEPGVRAVTFLEKRSWNEQGADLRQVGETSLVRRSKYRILATRP